MRLTRTTIYKHLASWGIWARIFFLGAFVLILISKIQFDMGPDPSPENGPGQENPAQSRSYRPNFNTQ